MKFFNVFTAMRTLMLVSVLAVGASALTALADNAAPGGGGGTSTSSSQTTKTTTTVREEVTGINPIW
ncbi:MAG TPA: hypothetical protein VF791_14920 [Pyrinomonadaceae bacterium]